MLLRAKRRDDVIRLGCVHRPEREGVHQLANGLRVWGCRDLAFEVDGRAASNGRVPCWIGGQVTGLGGLKRRTPRVGWEAR